VLNRWGYRIKHLARISKDRDQLAASVKPVLVDSSHPLYAIEGVQNAVMVETSLAGKVTIQGAGAGKLPTASAMVEDLTYVLQSQSAVKRLPVSQSSEQPKTEREDNDRKVYLVIGSSGIESEFIVRNDVQIVKQEETGNFVYTFITCSDETSRILSSDRTLYVYEAAVDLKEIVSAELNSEVPKQVINL
jgi:homoserine dehydrogenase